jgi:hypothetical protein
MAAYADFLRANAQELDLLFKEMLIGVTSFFRDPEVWQDLQDKVLPVLMAQHARRRGPDARLGGRLFHRRGGLLAGHGLHRSAGRAAGIQAARAADLCHRPQRRRHRCGAHRPLSAQRSPAT